MRTPSRPIRVALQGGGAHGAYSWGVLDSLLASRTITLTHFSGASAGALNAAVCVSGLVAGGPREARSRLRSFWEAIAAGPLEGAMAAPWSAFSRRIGQGLGEWLWATSMAVPYRQSLLPRMHHTPLAAELARHVDLPALRSDAAPRLHVSLTQVRTGLPKIVGNADLSIDVLLASACLPQLFRAVEIDGEPYWDGGFTANPALSPLVQAPGDRDICLVQLAPDGNDRVPRTGAQVRRRVADVVFHASLVSELQTVVTMRALAREQGLAHPSVATRFHRIGPPDPVLLERSSAADRSRGRLEALAEAGRRDGRRFLRRHGDAIGKRESFAVAEVYPISAWELLEVPVVERADDAARQPEEADTIA